MDAPTGSPATPSTTRRLRVDIWTDVRCPWCYLGSHRLAEAVRAWEHGDATDVVLRSFELDPALPGELRDTQEMLAEKFGDLDAVVRMGEQIGALARAEGLPWGDNRLDASSFDAHRVLQLASEHGVGNELMASIQREHFGGTSTIFDHDVLVRLAEGAGLPTERVREVLAGDEYTDAVREDEALARRIGVTGVPFVVLDGKYGVSGARSVEDYRSALDQAWSTLGA